jgi:pimeloyl-ACP methyl ester carboxylesterase
MKNLKLPLYVYLAVLLHFILSMKTFSQTNNYQWKELFIATSDSINLWVKTLGNKNKEACLFINGAGANSSFWSDNLCSTLIEKGFYVIKYDHRDFGYSDKLDFEKQPYDVMDLAKDEDLPEVKHFMYMYRKADKAAQEITAIQAKVR